MSRGDIKRFREHLNQENQGQPNHKNGRYEQRTRPYGDYLYAQDREKFMVDMEEWLRSQKPKFPMMSEFEQKVFARFARAHKPGWADHPIQLEGDGRIAICAAAHRLMKKGVLIKHQACCWYLTDLGRQMAVEWKKTQPQP